MIKQVLVVVLMAYPAFAQAISGTVSANFTGFNDFGQPTTHVDLNLACSLSCPPSAPTLTFGSGPVDGHFVVETTQRSGSLSFSFFSGVRTTGTSSVDSATFTAPVCFGGTCYSSPRKGFYLHGGSKPGSWGCVDIGGVLSETPTPRASFGTFEQTQTDSFPSQ